MPDRTTMPQAQSRWPYRLAIAAYTVWLAVLAIVAMAHKAGG